jgi:hypothetical protein
VVNAAAATSEVKLLADTADGASCGLPAADVESGILR